MLCFYTANQENQLNASEVLIKLLARRCEHIICKAEVLKSQKVQFENGHEKIPV